MTFENHKGAPAPVAPVRRLHQYPGCAGFVLRWFIPTDAVPLPYLTEEEALAELRRRQADRRQP